MTTPEQKLTLEGRVIAYKCGELPGQPMSMHMGTSYLISDLSREVKVLTKERDALTLANKDLSNWFDALKSDYDKLLAAGKLALEALDGLIQVNGCTAQAWQGHHVTEIELEVSDAGKSAIAALKQAGVS